MVKTPARIILARIAYSQSFPDILQRWRVCTHSVLAKKQVIPGTSAALPGLVVRPLDVPTIRKLLSDPAARFLSCLRCWIAGKGTDNSKSKGKMDLVIISITNLHFKACLGLCRYAEMSK